MSGPGSWPTLRTVAPGHAGLHWHLGVAERRVAADETRPRDWARATTDCGSRGDVRAKLRSTIKRLLAKHGYPPDAQQDAIDLVIRQMEKQSRMGGRPSRPTNHRGRAAASRSRASRTLRL